MRAYIQTDAEGEYYNTNAFVAAEGFRLMGWEILKFKDVEAIPDRDPEDLLVGGVGNVRRRLEMLGCTVPSEYDYPPVLEPYFGRKIWVSTLPEVLQNPAWWPVFVKPKDLTKRFTGKVIRGQSDFTGILREGEDLVVWCSEPVDFVAEWRCFVRYGRLLDVRHYHGVWDSRLDVALVEQSIAAFKDAPAAYSLDFGADKTGRCLLVEMNDGHSLGSYGIRPTLYAKFLSARWAQLTGTRDWLRD